MHDALLPRVRLVPQAYVAVFEIFATVLDTFTVLRSPYTVYFSTAVHIFQR